MRRVEDHRGAALQRHAGPLQYRPVDPRRDLGGIGLARQFLGLRDPRQSLADRV